MTIIILHIDDNIEDLEVTSQALKEVSPQVVYVPLDEIGSTDRLNDIAAGPPSEIPSLIIVDLHMPYMSGHQVIHHLQNDERLKSIPVVVLTGSSEEAAMGNQTEMANVLFFTKPTDFQEMKKLLRGLVDGLENKRKTR